MPRVLQPLLGRSIGLREAWLQTDDNDGSEKLKRAGVACLLNDGDKLKPVCSCNVVKPVCSPKSFKVQILNRWTANLASGPTVLDLLWREPLKSSSILFEMNSTNFDITPSSLQHAPNSLYNYACAGFMSLFSCHNNRSPTMQQPFTFTGSSSSRMN